MEKAPEADPDDYLAWLGTEARPTPDLPIPESTRSRAGRAKEEADPSRRRVLTDARRRSARSCNTCLYRKLFRLSDGLYFKCSRDKWREIIMKTSNGRLVVWPHGVPYVRHKACSKYKFTLRYLKREDFEEGGKFCLG